MLNDVAVIIAVASFLGAILGAGLSNLVAARLATQERKENRRKERVASLSESLSKLINIRGEIQVHSGDGRELYFSTAYGIMLSLSDLEILEKARSAKVGSHHTDVTGYNNKIDAIDFSIQRLGDMITAIETE